MVRSLLPCDETIVRSVSEAVDPRKLGLGLILVGALTVVISDFLPLVSSTTFGRVAENTAVQHDGWLYFIGVALVLMAALGSPASRFRISWPVGLAAAMFVGSIYFGLISKSARTLYSIGLDGQAVPGTREVAAPGVGAYAMVLSTLILLIGSVQLRNLDKRSLASSEESTDATKVEQPI